MQKTQQMLPPETGHRSDLAHDKGDRARPAGPEEPFVPDSRTVPPEAAEEPTCRNCGSPLVIRGQAWVCFTCAFEIPA